MSRLWDRLWRDEAGVIISAELVLILTIVVIGVLVGLVQLRSAIVTELHDIGVAFSHLNQSFAFTGFRGNAKWWGWKQTSWTAGSSFFDIYDGTTALISTDVVGTAGPYPPAAVGVGGVCNRAVPAVCRPISATIVLSNGTLIPLTPYASGTWSLPGGALLAASSTTTNTLLLADGSTIPFICGASGIVTYADGKVTTARPGVAGTLVLGDGTIATLDATAVNTAKLPDGTVVTFQPVDAQKVVLPDGVIIEVKSGEKGTLILPDGRVLQLKDAVLPPGSSQAPCWTGSPQPHCNTAVPMLPQGNYLPDGGEYPPTPQPDFAAPGAPVPSQGLWNHGSPRKLPRRLQPEIPQGPAPQNLPQL